MVRYEDCRRVVDGAAPAVSGVQAGQDEETPAGHAACAGGGEPCYRRDSGGRGRAGLENNFNGCCVTSSGEPWETRNRVTLTLTYDEDSFVSRRSRVKGFLQLTEQLRIYTAKVLELQRVKRLHFSGASKGLHIGPIQMLAWEDLWKVPKTSKSQIYGSAGKVLAGH